jgi:hypothetical protein
MTLRAPGTTSRTSARRSAVRVIHAISPAYPRSSHSRRNAKLGKIVDRRDAAQIEAK